MEARPPRIMTGWPPRSSARSRDCAAQSPDPALLNLELSVRARENPLRLRGLKDYGL